MTTFTTRSNVSHVRKESIREASTECSSFRSARHVFAVGAGSQTCDDSSKWRDSRVLASKVAYLGLDAADQRSLQSMGDALVPIKRLGDDTGCAIQLGAPSQGADHSGWPSSADITGVGFEELARYSLLLNSRRLWNSVTGEHWLRLVISNKSGEQRFHLDVREGRANGPERRVWEPTITVPTATPDKMPSSKNQRRKRPAEPSDELSENEQSMLNVLKQHPDGLNMTALGRTSNVSYRRWKLTIKSLMDRTLIEKFTANKSKGKEVTRYRILKAEA